jgi:predicted transcriptional regulator
LWKILEIFNKESSKDIKTLDVAKLIGIGRSKKAVKNLLHFLKSKNILTVKTGEKGADPRWSRHPTNTYTGIFISFLFI